MVVFPIVVGTDIIAGGPLFICLYAKSWAVNTLVEKATTTCMNHLTPSIGFNTPVLVKHAALLAEYGCWNFWSYSSPDNPNPDYFIYSAPQLRAIYRMISRLAEPRS